jgi:hypothetical protein
VYWMFVVMDASLMSGDMMFMLCLLYDAGGGCSMDGLLSTWPVAMDALRWPGFSRSMEQM